MAKGDNAGHVWNLSTIGHQSLRGYDMAGVVVEVPDGHVVEVWQDGFDIWRSRLYAAIWRLCNPAYREGRSPYQHDEPETATVAAKGRPDKPEPPFKPGDLVELKCGGCRMTVEAIRYSCAPGDFLVDLVWGPNYGDAELSRETLPAALLKPETRFDPDGPIPF